MRFILTNATNDVDLSMQEDEVALRDLTDDAEVVVSRKELLRALAWARDDQNAVARP